MNLAHLYKEHLEHTPGKPAVICDHDSLTYADLDKNAADFRSVLLSLNVQEGDRVSFLTGNTLFLTPAYMGCFQSGAVAVPSSYFSSEEELVYESNHCQTSIYFVSKEWQKIIQLQGDKAKKFSSLRFAVSGGSAVSQDLQENITGEILVKTDMMMSGYHNDPENTKNSFTDGWYKSGDLAFKDNDGYFS